MPADTSTLNWLHQLKLDPSLRAAAGMGAESIRRNQESYMDQCWEQIGDVILANKRLREAQLAKEAGGAIYRKHLEGQSDARLLGLSHLIQRKVPVGDETVWQKSVESSLPVAAQSGAFRRIVRPSGPIMKKIQPVSSLTEYNELVTGLALNSISAVAPKVIPDAQNHVSQSSIRYLTNYTASRYISSSVRFALTAPGESRSVTNNKEAKNFQAAIKPFRGYFDTSQWQALPQPAALDTNSSADALRAKLNPSINIP